MIRPAHFGYNTETAPNNAFQSQDDSLTKEEISEKAKVEFDGFVKELRETKVAVMILDYVDYGEMQKGKLLLQESIELSSISAKMILNKKEEDKAK